MAGLVPAISIGRGAAVQAIGITALDTLSRHGRACAGHLDPVRRSALRIGITGTSPVMTASLERVCNVLTLFLRLCIIWARPLLIPARRGRAREASQEWGGERSCSRPRTPVGGRPLAALGWSKSKRLKVPRARRRPALPIPPSTSSRAAQRTTLDHTSGSQRKQRATRCWLCDRRMTSLAWPDATTACAGFRLSKRPVVEP